MKTISIIVLIILANGLFNWLTNLPHDIGNDIPQGKLNSLSFAPYRDGQSPLEGKFPTAAQIDADLALLADKTYSIRTYASSESEMASIPALAQKHGLTMTQGAWLNSADKDNQQEIKVLIHAANTYPDVVKRVIVGNEVLLRKDLKIDQLINYIRTVKKAVKQPVSYADVWSIYMKYPQLINEVDFVTIHILPYWEDDPVTIEKAPEHIVNIYKKVQEKAAGKDILIGESGWPSAGRQRGSAVPSVVNEARFIRELIQLANKNHFDYNIVEAVNQSWKSDLEGVVGANWGLFAADRTEVFPLTGSVYETPRWAVGLSEATGLFLFITLCFWRQIKELATLHPAKLGVFLVFGQLLSALLVDEVNWLWVTSFNDWQRVYAVTASLLSTVMAGLFLHCAYKLLTQGIMLHSGAWLYTLYMIFVGFALYKTYGIALDGRYISFPYLTTCIPVIGVICLMVVGYFMSDRRFSLRLFSLNELTNVTHPSFKINELQFSEFATATDSSERMRNISELIGHSAVDQLQDKVLGYLMFITGLALLVIAVALLVGETYAYAHGGDLILAYPEPSDLVWRAFILTVSNEQLIKWFLSLIVLAIPLLTNGCTKRD